MRYETQTPHKRKENTCVHIRETYLHKPKIETTNRWVELGFVQGPFEIHKNSIHADKFGAEFSFSNRWLDNIYRSNERMIEL